MKTIHQCLCLLLLLFLAVSCAKKEEGTKEESTKEVIFNDNAEELVVEAMKPIVELCCQEDAQLVDFKPLVDYFVKVITTIVEQSPMEDDQIYARHLAAVVADQLMQEVDKTDSLQVRYFADSILVPLSLASHHWYISKPSNKGTHASEDSSDISEDTLNTSEENDEAQQNANSETEKEQIPIMVGYSFTELDTEEIVYSSIWLFFKAEKAPCIVTFPRDFAKDPKLLFYKNGALYNDEEPFATLTAEDAKHSMQDDDESWLFFYPLEQIVSLMEQSDILMLSYTTTDNSERMQPYVLEEFQRQYKELMAETCN